jgi:alkylation response protein AidB-like acyl-CoA dehydrogenase
MDFGLTAEQQQLKESAHSFLAKECPTARVRQIMASSDGMSPELHDEIAKLGWHSLLIPAEYGGAGLSMLDMALLLEECGYAALPGPFLFSSVLAAWALSAGAPERLKHKWLAALGEGRALGTLAVAEANDSLNPADFSTRARSESEGFVLNGTKMFVPYPHLADFLLVAARTDDGDIALFAVNRDAPGVQVKLHHSLDLTRRVGMVELAGVKVNTDAVLQAGPHFYHRLLAIGAVAIAADSLGGMERALEMAVEYSKIREQFGKPIGAYQALQHAAAEIVADLEPARSLLWYAAHAQDAVPADALRSASMVKARMCEAFMRNTDKAVLMHGGIGFTWDHDIHLWFKRARFNESLFGPPSFHRERVAMLSGYGTL